MHATEMKTKRHYTTPVTQRATVELEGGFCGSIYGPNTVESKGHEMGNEYTFDNDGVGGNFGTTSTTRTDDGFSVTWK